MQTSLAQRLPPVLVFALVGLSMALLARIAPGTGLPLPTNLLSALCLALTIAGAGTATAGVVEFVRARTTADPRTPDRATRLVTTGVFRFTRNPMYLGLMLLLVAWAVRLDHAAALIGPPLFMAWIDRMQIPFEESAMRSRFGDAFERYCQTTRRWI